MKMDDHSYNTDNLLLNFPPFLQKHLEELFLNRQQNPITLERFCLKDISPLLSKQYKEDVSSYSYHYTLKIPYGGKRLNWEMIFNPENLSFAPDFCFNDDFLYDPDLDVLIDNVPSLVNWNINNPKCLAAVLEELLKLYKKFQIEKLRKDNIYAQIYNEYEMLMEDCLLDSTNLEIIADANMFYFLMDIKVDASSLPNYIQPLQEERYENWLNPGRDQATLKIQFFKLDGSRVNVSLHLSPSLEQVLGNSRTLQIPYYTKNTVLTNYVNDISKLLQDRVKKIEEHHKLKKEFITYVCSKRIESLIESDTEHFKSVSFLCSIEDSYFLVCINIGKKLYSRNVSNVAHKILRSTIVNNVCSGDNFPNERPDVVFQSAYCGSVVTVDDYPYSPRWSPENVIKKLLSYLADAIPKSFGNKNLNMEN